MDRTFLDLICQLIKNFSTLLQQKASYSTSVYLDLHYSKDYTTATIASTTRVDYFIKAKFVLKDFSNLFFSFQQDLLLKLSF